MGVYCIYKQGGIKTLKTKTVKGEKKMENKVEWILECGEASRKENRSCGFITMRAESEILEKLEKELSGLTDTHLTWVNGNLILEKLYNVEESNIDEVDSFLESTVTSAIEKIK